MQLRCSNGVACDCPLLGLTQQDPHCPTLVRQHFTDITGYRCRKTFSKVTDGSQEGNAFCQRSLKALLLFPLTPHALSLYFLLGSQGLEVGFG